MGLTIRRGPDGLPTFSYADAPARQRTPEPRPRRKVPPLIQYRYRAPREAPLIRYRAAHPAARRLPAARRERRPDHTVTWPGPGLTGVPAGHSNERVRLQSPHIAGWIPREDSGESTHHDAKRETALRAAGPSPARLRLREIERENAELVAYIGRSRPSPAMDRPRFPEARAGGGRHLLPDCLDREARPVASPSRPPAVRRRRRVADILPAADDGHSDDACPAPLPMDAASEASASRADDARYRMDGPEPELLSPGARLYTASLLARRPVLGESAAAGAPAPSVARAPAPRPAEVDLEPREASAFECGPASTPTAELLAGVFSPECFAPPPPELVRTAPAVVAAQKRLEQMAPRRAVRASPGKDPRALAARAERLAATPATRGDDAIFAKRVPGRRREEQQPVERPEKPVDAEVETHVSLRTRRKRAAMLAHESKIKRQHETAVRNAFLDTQLARVGSTLAQLSVEMRHRYAHGLAKAEEPPLDMKVRARQEYSELAEFHLTNYERLLEKYAGALMVESRQELDLNGGPQETEYRALVAMEGFKPEPSGEKRYPTLPVVRQALLEDRTVEEPAHRPKYGDVWLQNRFSELVNC